MENFTPLDSKSKSSDPKQPMRPNSRMKWVPFGFVAILLVGIISGALVLTRNLNQSSQASEVESTVVNVEVHSFVGSAGDSDSDGRFDGWFAVILDDGTPLIDWMQTGFFGPTPVTIPAGHTAMMYWDVEKNGSEAPYVIDPTVCTAEGVRATTTEYTDLHLDQPEEPRSAGRRSVEAFCGVVNTLSPTPTPVPPTPTPVPVCGSVCEVGSGTANCPANNTCSADGRCELTACGEAGAVCDADKCNVIIPTPTPPPVLECGSTCTADSQCPGDYSCSGDEGAKKCVLSKCLQQGVICAADQCKEIACIAPPPPINVRIDCPNCSGTAQ